MNKFRKQIKPGFFNEGMLVYFAIFIFICVITVFGKKYKFEEIWSYSLFAVLFGGWFFFFRFQRYIIADDDYVEVGHLWFSFFTHKLNRDDIDYVEFGGNSLGSGLHFKMMDGSIRSFSISSMTGKQMLQFSKEFNEDQEKRKKKKSWRDYL